MAGIKFHGAVDVQIIGNHIYRSDMGVWLDWMAQGVHVTNNLMYDNTAWDLFLEVDHGPMMVYNNIFLSKVYLFMNSSGAVFAQNLFGGKITLFKEKNVKRRITKHILQQLLMSWITKVVIFVL